MGSEELGAAFKIPRRSACALRVRGKPSWAGVALGGMARWATPASVALAEHGFPLTKHRFIMKTAPSIRHIKRPAQGISIQNELNSADFWGKFKTGHQWEGEAQFLRV